MKLSQSKLIRLGVVLAGVVVLYSLFTSYGSGLSVSVDSASELGGTGPMAPLSDQGPSAVSSHSVGGNAAPTSGMQGRTPASQQTYTENMTNPGELLPKGEIGASWAANSPLSADDLKGQNFLGAGYHSNTSVIGVSQTTRNPTYDIRSEVANPQGAVGPFLNTTITPDPFRTGGTHALEGLGA